jgi:hypothetical protein
VVDLADLLCVKGEILSSMSQQDASEGLACLLQALEVAQRRLLSLELRSGISLARLWADRGEADRALELLEPIFSRFSEGFQTLDLMAAAKLLAKLRSL